MRFTTRVIDGLTCPEGARDKLYFDEVQRGLAVRVTAGSSKTYLCQYTLAGAKKRVPLGAVDAISLAAAREAVQAILGEVAKGNDPAANRKAAAAAVKAQKAHEALTLDVLIAEWHRLGLAANKPAYAAEAVRALRKAYADHLAKPAADIDRKLVLKVHDKMVAAGKGTTAARVVAYGKACYSWANKRGTLSLNPFLGQPVQAPKERDRVLSNSELAEIWAQAGADTTFGAIIRMLMLTGQRRDEVAGMTWDELAPDLATWTLPADRVKNSTPHLVPLPAPARELIAAQPRLVRKAGEDDFVFPGRVGQFSGWSRCKERLDAAINAARVKASEEAGEDPALVKPMAPWVLHDLRRTLATGLQRLGVRLEVTEAVLNHTSGSRSGIVGVYQRHDWREEKAAALEAWAAHVAAVVTGQAVAGNVVKLRA
ncbi:site-specific recombinase XerD [Nitrospirillum amazonense]|uniref:Site-specific recombinase XerD n=1 Tax=Nitrospirillum amazonense TaxID=28077 RepID=A0A560FKM2_9PROT|nr:site-specific integrase [Nitrospirillum amazonense]TWB22152.1 site-specific recombinase XerD [Nitrospirillum amazonense]